jgi:hypothetical protein
MSHRSIAVLATAAALILTARTRDVAGAGSGVHDAKRSQFRPRADACFNVGCAPIPIELAVLCRWSFGTQSDRNGGCSRLGGRRYPVRGRIGCWIRSGPMIPASLGPDFSRVSLLGYSQMACLGVGGAKVPVGADQQGTDRHGNIIAGCGFLN